MRERSPERKSASNTICGVARLLILAVHLAGEPCNEPTQMVGHAFVDDMLPILPQLFGNRGLLGAA